MCTSFAHMQQTDKNVRDALKILDTNNRLFTKICADATTVSWSFMPVCPFVTAYQGTRFHSGYTLTYHYCCIYIVSVVYTYTIIKLKANLIFENMIFS